jgi:hypothetical protein
MMDVEAPIRPGYGAAGLALGGSADALGCDEGSRTWLGDREVIDLGVVVVWVRAGFIEQICVRRSYAGAIAGTEVRIGSTLQQVGDVFGPVFEDDEDNLVVSGLPGLCFETERWRGDGVAQNLDAKITEICVFSIARSSAGKTFN